MTNIVKKPNDENRSEIEKLKSGKQIKLPPIAQRLRDYQKKTVEADLNASTLSNRIALILDCSGSMSGEPIELLKKAVEAFAESCNFTNTSVALRPFPQGDKRPLTALRPLIIASAQMLDAGGGTPMGQAMDDTITNVPITRAVLVSDGEPTDDSHWRNVCQKYVDAEIPIDTVHIGESDSGTEVLQEIAHRTGGIFMKFHDIHSFATSFSYLTPAKRALLKSASADEVKRLTGADDVK